MRLLALAPLVFGCSGVEIPDTAEHTATDSPVDTADSAAETDDPCAGVPVVTWANFGRGFMTQHCQPCHASTAPDRHGAPEYITFDTVEAVWGARPRILDLATGEDPEMPPAGGVPEDERIKLGWWLGCADPGS